MAAGKVCWRKKLTFTHGAFAVIAGLFLGTVENANADLVRYSYTTSSGVTTTASPGIGFINPASGVSFLISIGL